MTTRLKHLSIIVRIMNIRRSTNSTRLLISTTRRSLLIRQLIISTSRMTMRIRIRMMRHLTTQRQRMNMSIIRMRHIHKRKRTTIARGINTMTRQIRRRILNRIRITSLIPHSSLITLRSMLMISSILHIILSILMSMINSSRIRTRITPLRITGHKRGLKRNIIVRPIVKVSSLRMRTLYILRNNRSNRTVSTILLVGHLSSI